MSHRMSFEAAQRQANGRPLHPYVANYPELLPLDISSATASPDSAAASSASHRSAPGFQQQTPGGAGNPLYQLDAMMFPSGDPFAYPNQPAMSELSLPHHSAHPPSSSQDQMQFYMPNIYDDIEGQLLGPIPPYLMQSSQPGGVNMSTRLYSASGIPNMQHGPPSQAQQAAQQRHQREIEDLLADPSFDPFAGNFRPL
jgi:hypothetical protein